MECTRGKLPEVENTPFFYPIKYMKTKDLKRMTAALLRLRTQLIQEMPAKTRKDTIVLGTCNFRNFDDNRFANGERTAEDLFYMAEISLHFDVIAVQEICEDLGPLDEAMCILGRQYAYILMDVTEGVSGKGERLGFIYDKAKVNFKGVSGELVLPDNLQIVDGEPKLQFSRTPLMCISISGPTPAGNLPVV